MVLGRPPGGFPRIDLPLRAVLCYDASERPSQVSSFKSPIMVQTFSAFLALFCLAVTGCRSSRPNEGSAATVERSGETLSPSSTGRGSLEGRFLVAQPQVEDPRFARSVVFLVAHDEGGAMGLVVNRPLGSFSSRELLSSIGLEADRGDGEAELFLHYGGPVEPRRGFILHSSEQTGKSSREVIPGVAFSADAVLLKAIVDRKGPQQYLIFLGYAGWAPGQLEREIERGDWLVLEGEADLVFGVDPEHLWEQLMGDRVLRM